MMRVFSETRLHLLSPHEGQVSLQMVNHLRGKCPLEARQLEMLLSPLPVKWGLWHVDLRSRADVHAHICHAAFGT